MLQHPLPLPSSYDLSSKRNQTSKRGPSDDSHLRKDPSSSRHAPATIATVASSDSRFPSSQPFPLTHPHLIPLDTSFPKFSPSFSPSSSQPSSPLPTPSILTSKPFPRSPLLSNVSSPIPRSPRPTLHSGLPSFETTRFSTQLSSGSISSVLADVLSPGDLLGEDMPLQGELITRVVPSVPAVDSHSAAVEPAKEFEVVRRLGTGSYAVVYLVKEVLARPAVSDDGHCSAVGRMEMDGELSRDSWEYGREFAVKLLSKANLDEEALDSQLFEATIHQSLPPHPNIVTLHRTLETPSFLLLLLEFVPGEDLFYFLEQARDHYDADPSTALELSTSPDSSISSCSRTPPTPSLLSSMNPSQLLSRTRLRLIASMFAQMCEAVAVCHENSVFHRDIKPENFIVTDGWTEMEGGRRERRVVVKLTDFGLSTRDARSSDMDCGSAPYMSYECRNNLHPTYSPRAADVWSLGIVLINMLYHYNPWTDTTEGQCSSFVLFRQQPLEFFMQRFMGMTLPVAQFLATKVFCILDNPEDDSPRIEARLFGQWAKELPTLLSPSPSPMTPTSSSFVPGHSRNVSVSSVITHSLASVPHSRRPSLRHAPSSDASVAKQRASWNLSRAPSLEPAYETSMELPAAHALSTVLDQEPDEREQELERDEEHDPEEPSSRSASTHKRRKRGARKGKNLQLNMGLVGAGGSVESSIQTQDELDDLAENAQQLAREISRTSRTSGAVDSPRLIVPPLPTAAASFVAAPVPVQATSTILKKQSKWKLSFGKSASTSGGKSPVEETTPVSHHEAAVGPNGKPMSATASNVTSLLMGLNAPPPSSAAQHQESAATRGRRVKSPPSPPNMWGPSAVSAAANTSNSAFAASNGGRGPRGASPASTRSGRPLASSASSMASSNWRSSMSSAGTSTSAFTKYSNGSTRSVSTAATSVSSTSWRSGNGSKYEQANAHHGQPQLPANVKVVTGTPWELNVLPRQMYRNPEDVKFSAPPARKPRAPKSNLSESVTLGTISERPQNKEPDTQRMDASTSTTELDTLARDRDRDSNGSHEGTPRKVQKGQINALAKMLQALRR